MEKKQTACDWLHCQLDELEKTKHERSLSLHLDLRDEIFKEAKAIEKQQIVDGVYAGYNYDGGRLEEHSEQYYNETYQSTEPI